MTVLFMNEFVKITVWTEERECSRLDGYLGLSGLVVGKKKTQGLRTSLSTPYK